MINYTLEGLREILARSCLPLKGAAVMYFICFIIFFPFLAALLMLPQRRSTRLRTFVASGCAFLNMAACIAGAAIVWTGRTLPGGNGENNTFLMHPFVPNLAVICGEIFLMVLVFYYAIRYRKIYAALLSAAGTLPVLWLDLIHNRAKTAEEPYLRIDDFSALMFLLVGVVGGLIIIYANGYIKDYHEHHKEFKDRSGWFLAMLFVFIGAINSLIVSDNLGWMFFFWEITSICSFLLIGYNKQKQAIDNSFKALWMNLLGGLGFTVAILYSELALHIDTLSRLTADTTPEGKAAVALPVIMLAFAALTKSAQMPFCGWLLGAMVAPTPTSALLHGATMVKAGVYLLLRLSPVMNGMLSGTMVMIIGGFTFFAASMMAIATSDGKRVLAHSTVSNLGLICACAGVGLPESVWAGTMLILFHAVSKSLMFLCVGAVENCTGSRNIEDMHGLIVRLPHLATAMIIGICGMSLAPFGMLVAKWAALKSFVDAGNIALILFLVFGSATTTFYWTKWLGKLFAVLHNTERIPETVHKNEWAAIIPLAGLVVMLMFLFPAISAYVIQPILGQSFPDAGVQRVISSSDMYIMMIMLAIIVLLPVLGYFMNRARSKKHSDKFVLTYMSGANAGDDRHFINSYGQPESVYMANWYITNWFGELVLMKPCLIAASGIIAVFLVIAIGGAI